MRALPLHYDVPFTFKFPHYSLSPSLCHLPAFSQGSSSSGRTRSFSLLPHLTPSSSPGSQRHLSHTASPSNIVTITHHKSPAAARRAKSLYPGRLLEVKEVGVKVIAVYFLTVGFETWNSKQMHGHLFFIFLPFKDCTDSKWARGDGCTKTTWKCSSVLLLLLFYFHTFHYFCQFSHCPSQIQCWDL